MDTSENTARLVDNTYRNVIEEFGPCIKQLVVAGRTYLKSIHSMIAAYRNYTDALSRVATLADHSTLRGSNDIGAALHHIVEVNKEFQTQQSNIMKSLEFDFLEAMEIAADKDTKLVGREQKRFQQLHRNRREAFVKCVSTLKKSRRKKNINTDKQLAQIKMMENAKARLDEFCEDSLKEAIVQERVLYGTVLERQCALNKQILIYHTKGCEILNANIPEWEKLAETRETLPNGCFPLQKVSSVSDKKEFNPNDIDGYYYVETPTSTILRNTSQSRRGFTVDRNSMMSLKSQFMSSNNNNSIYAKPIIRAKSEYNLPASTTDDALQSDSSPTRLKRIVEYNGQAEKYRVRAIYPYEANGDHQMSLAKGDIIEFTEYENITGWIYGDNLTSKRSGWFPISYTEFITEDRISSPSRNSVVDARNYEVENNIQCSQPTSTGSLYSKASNFQTQEYGTIQRITHKKPLPVEPPIVTSSFTPTDEALTATLKSLRHHSSQPNIYDPSLSSISMPGTSSRTLRNGVETMHL